MVPNPQLQPKNNELEVPTESPQVGPDLRLKQQVKDALDSIPEGEKLDRYFGITSGSPEQPEEEAVRSEKLIQGLQRASTGQQSLSELLGQIAEHNSGSGVDPNALRALMRGSNKKKSD